MATPCRHQLALGALVLSCALEHRHEGIHRARERYSWGAVTHASPGVCEESIAFDGTHHVCSRRAGHAGCEHAARFALCIDGELCPDPFPVVWTARLLPAPQQHMPPPHAFYYAAPPFTAFATLLPSAAQQPPSAFRKPAVRSSSAARRANWR